MTTVWLLYALSRIIQEEKREAGEIALEDCDPLLKRSCRKRLAKAVYAAELESGSDDDAHIARVAFLRLKKMKIAGSFDDVKGVRQQYEGAFAECVVPKGGPRLSLALFGALIVAASLFYAIHLATRPFSPAQLPAGTLFEWDFTHLSVSLTRRDADMARHTVEEFSGESALKASQKKLEALVESALAVGDEATSQQAYRRAAVSLNRSLEQSDLPFYVDADLYPLGGKLSPILMSFYVQERGEYHSDSQRIPVLRLWRLDHLNVVQARLGYTRASSPYAILLLDRIEHDLVTQILPSLPKGELMSLTDQDTELSQEEWVAQIQLAGGEIVQKHYDSQSPELRAAATRLGALLAERRRLLADWKDKLGRKLGGVRMPRRLMPEADYAEELSLLVPRKGLRAWDTLHEKLLSQASIVDFEAVREAALRSVERHEVQHRLDYAEERLEIPVLLAKRLGGIETMGHGTHSLPMRATTELSAYLSQMADDPSPLLAVLTMSRIFLGKRSIRSAHGYAGIVAIEETAQQLGIDTNEALGRRITRAELAQLVIRVCGHSSEEIRRAAGKAFKSLFKKELPKVTRGNFKASPRWRH